VPIPVPLTPPVTVIQLTLLVAVHEQAVPVTTDRLPVFAVDGTEALVVPSEYMQLFANCVIVTVLPAIVSVPVRTLPVGFAATL
jgi:hypothetical protein